MNLQYNDLPISLHRSGFGILSLLLGLDYELDPPGVSVPVEHVPNIGYLSAACGFRQNIVSPGQHRLLASSIAVEP